MSVQLTQEEVLEELQDEGFEVDERHLRYLRSLNKIPQLIREGNGWYYQRKEIDSIKSILYFERKVKSSILLLHSIEGEVFEVTSIEIHRRSNDRVPEMILHLREGGVIIRDMREDELNAISKDS